jgi:hypothetical protein
MHTHTHTHTHKMHKQTQTHKADRQAHKHTAHTQTHGAARSQVVWSLLALNGAGHLDDFNRHVGTLQSAVNTIGVALFFLMGFRTNSRLGSRVLRVLGF